MKAYKATYNLKCETITYEVGKTYTFEGELKMCEQGFHFCKNPKDTLSYYDYNKDYKLMEIDVLGEMIDENDKSVTNKFKVLRIIDNKDELSKLLNVEFDQNNNLIHFKNSYGYEDWYEYDKNNNSIHSKDSNGFEYWRKYDKNNNLIHYKSSTGFEYWQEFDENNNLIYFKNNINREWEIIE